MDTRFGELLRKVRVDAQRSLGEVARHLGVSVVYLSDVERGRRGPLSLQKIIDAASFLGVRPLPLLKSAAQHRGSFDLDVTDYPDSAFELLSSLARGKRSDEIYQQLLQALEKYDESEDANK